MKCYAVSAFLQDTVELLHMRVGAGRVRLADLLRAITGQDAGIDCMPVMYTHIGHLVRAALQRSCRSCPRFFVCCAARCLLSRVQVQQSRRVVMVCCGMRACVWDA